MGKKEKQKHKVAAKTDQPLKISNQVIHPGESVSLNIPVAKLYTHAELTMPVQVIHSKEKGPRLFLTAALHGDEINGVEIIRRILKVITPQKIRGSLITVPVVNTHGFITRSRYLPDRRDLNRSFPGSSDGSLTSRLADLFMKEIVAQSTHGIDLHTAAIHRDNLPQIRVCLKDRKAKEMAQAFNAPVVIDSELVDGSLRQEVFKRKIPIIVYEGGEALRFKEIAIRAGVNGILSVMHHLGMLLKKPNTKSVNSSIAKSSKWVRAPESGLFRARKKLGSHINKGDILGYIADPFGKQEIQVKSPLAGIIVGKSQLPLVDKGDAIYHIATFSKAAPVANVVSEYEMELSEKSIFRNVNL